jgi:hypothetical protein
MPVVLVFANDAPFAERFVVDAEVADEVETVRVPTVEVEVKVLPKVDDAAESSEVEAVRSVELVAKSDVMVAPLAERLVVEAFVAVNVVLVRVAMKPFVKERPVPEIPVVEAFVTVRVPMNADASVAPVAERLVVEATVIVVVASVEVPVTTSAPEVVVAEVIAPVNVLSPAKVCEVVDMKPRAVAEASGMLKVCVDPVESILKLVPAVPIANVCTPTERPFSVEIPPVAEPTSIKTTLPRASTVSALPVKDEVALPEVSEENASPPTVVVALEVMFVALRVPMNA